MQHERGNAVYPFSPCIRQCCLDEQDICVGCYRTLTEITSWSRVSDTERADIMVDCVKRRNQSGRENG